MGALKVILPLFVFLLLINISVAYTLESYNIEYTIVDSKVLVQIDITSAQTRTIKLPIPSDASTIELYLNSNKTNANIKDNSIILNLNKNDQIKLSYITKEFLDKTNFLLNLPIEYNTNSLEITVILPEESTLKRPIKDTTGSIYPRPDKATTDGRSLIFIWEKEDVKAGDDVSIFVMYKTRKNYIPVIVIAAAVLVWIYLIYKYQPKKEKKVKKKKMQKRKAEPKVLKHLKEDEQQIVRILKQRKGICEQGTLRVVTGFSKASLSRLLSELEERKIIYKEKRGKKNLIFLK